jgi:predicted DNA-binding transcriptional regulator AlpA
MTAIQSLPKNSHGFVGLNDLAESLGMERTAMWRLRQRGEGPAPIFRYGSRRLVVRQTDAQRWIESRMVK